MCWPGAVADWLLHILHINPSTLILFCWVQDGHQLADVFLVSSFYQSHLAESSDNTLAYHSKGPCCSGSNQTINQIQGCKASKELLRYQVKQTPLPYCPHTFIMKDNPQSGSPSMHTHFVTVCFPSFPTRADGGVLGCGSQVWPIEEADVQFVNNIFSWGVWHLPDKHRCYPLLFRNGSRKFVTWKKGTPSPMERVW